MPQDLVVEHVCVLQHSIQRCIVIVYACAETGDITYELASWQTNLLPVPPERR